jgi:heat shock protein HtpX
MKRIALFLLTNVAVVVVLGIVASLLGVNRFLTSNGLNLGALLGFLAAIIVAWFSRQREFRADAGAAQLMGRKQPMINALYRLGGMHPGEMPKSLQAMGITGSIGKLFSSHPPIEERVAALQQG